MLVFCECYFEGYVIMLGSWLDVKQTSQLIRRFSTKRLPKLIPSVIPEMGEEKLWQFRVRVYTPLRESVFVVGDCRQLGNWSSGSAVQLTCEAEPEPDG